MLNPRCLGLKMSGVPRCVTQRGHALTITDVQTNTPRAAGMFISVRACDSDCTGRKMKAPVDGQHEGHYRTLVDGEVECEGGTPTCVHITMTTPSKMHSRTALTQHTARHHSRSSEDASPPQPRSIAPRVPKASAADFSLEPRPAKRKTRLK